MTSRFDVDKFLEDLSGRHAQSYASALDAMVVAKAMGSHTGLFQARRRMEVVVQETMGAGEVLGASLALQVAAKTVVDVDDGDNATQRFGGMELWDHRSTLLSYADEPVQTILPRVSFAEAAEDMVRRAPVTLRRAAERTAQRVAQLYGERVVVAFVRSAEAEVTRKVQQTITQAIVEGIPEVDAARQIITNVDAVRKRTRAWSMGYAKTVFRTNLNTAVTAGRFRQAQDPDVVGLLPAMEYDAVGDADTRDNHAAADGVILRVDNPAWNKLAPPLGYNCRCQVRFRSVVELRRMGRIRNGQVIESRVPGDARPDVGFRHGGRPDLFLVRESK